MAERSLVNGLNGETKRKRKACAEAQNGTPEEGRLLQKVLELVEREHLISCPEDAKIVEFKHPKELEALLQLDISNQGMDHTQAEAFMEKVVRYSVRTQHPHFYNQFYGSIDEVALTGAWLTEALNTNQRQLKDIRFTRVSVGRYLTSYDEAAPLSKNREVNK